MFILLSKQGTLINTKNTKEHEKTLKNPKTNTKNKNHFIGLEHETVVELYLKTQKTQETWRNTRPTQKSQKHKNKREKRF